jgi:C-terminal processing protease CtpA/Prc
LLALALAFASACVPALAFSGCAGPAEGWIGAALGKDNKTGQLFVREVPPGMAAAYAGLRDDDEVIAIDGAPVADMSPAEVHRRLSGAAGTKVVLLIVRHGETRKIEVVRARLEHP